MKKNLLRIIAAAALSLPVAANAADPIYGIWVRDGHPNDKLEFYDCSGKLCAKGTLPMPDGSPAPIILRSAAKSGQNVWKGDLFNPEDGKTYSGKMTLSGTTLTTAGCVFGGLICKSTNWAKAN